MSIPQTLNSEESGLKGEAGPSHLPQEETVPRGTISPVLVQKLRIEATGFQIPHFPLITQQFHKDFL